jgi:hypothetical protein
MGLYDLRANMQAQAQALSIAGGGTAPKRLEYFADTVGGNRIAGIPHLEH